MFVQVVTVLILLLVTRIHAMISKPSPKPRKRDDGETCVLAVFLGSGGHTSEALMLTSSLDFTRYSPRIYIVSEGDTLSTNKAISLEHSKATCSNPIPGSDDRMDYKIVTVPRARRVHQAMWTILPTLMHSALACIYLVTIAPLLKKNPFGTPFADLLILNGPGTCVTLCSAVMVNKLLGLPHPKMIYVESYARVQSLSLSGKILRYFVDRFLVQWPTLLSGGGREDCYGCLLLWPSDAQTGSDLGLPGSSGLGIYLHHGMEPWNDIATGLCGSQNNINGLVAHGDSFAWFFWLSRFTLGLVSFFDRGWWYSVSYHDMIQGYVHQK